MFLFHFKTATEANDYTNDEILDQIWIKNDNGQLVLVEDETYENNKE